MAIPSVEQLNYCRILQLPSEGEALPHPRAVTTAWKTLEEHMALVPEGEVPLATIDAGSLVGAVSDHPAELAWVQTFYLDRVRG